MQNLSIYFISYAVVSCKKGIIKGLLSKYCVTKSILFTQIILSSQGILFSSNSPPFFEITTS